MSRRAPPEVPKNVLVVEMDAQKKFSRGYKKVKIEQFPTEQVEFELSLTQIMSGATQLRPCHYIFRNTCRCRTPARRKEKVYLKLDLAFENYMHQMSDNYKYKIACTLIDRARVKHQLCLFEEVRTSRFMNLLVDTNHCLNCIIDDIQEATISVTIDRFRINPSQIDTLQNDYLTLLDNPLHSDVILRVGYAEFSAHKNILTCRSPVFGAMFNYDMIENETGIVDIRDISDKAMTELLRYIYGGRVENLETMAPELLEAADKYQVDGLKYECIEYLIFNVNLDNIHKFYDLLNLYDMGELRDRVLTFIKSNKRIPRRDNYL